MISNFNFFPTPGMSSTCRSFLSVLIYYIVLTIGSTRNPRRLFFYSNLNGGLLFVDRRGQLVQGAVRSRPVPQVMILWSPVRVPARSKHFPDTVLANQKAQLRYRTWRKSEKKWLRPVPKCLYYVKESPNFRRQTTSPVGFNGEKL